MALAGKEPARVIGADAILKDRPGFEVELLPGLDPGGPYAIDRHEVLMVSAATGASPGTAARRCSRRATPAPCRRASAQPRALDDRRGEPLPRPQHRRSRRTDPPLTGSSA